MPTKKSPPGLVKTIPDELYQKIQDAKNRVKLFGTTPGWSSTGDPNEYRDLLQQIDTTFGSDPYALLVINTGHFEWNDETSGWRFSMPKTIEVIKMLKVNADNGLEVTMCYQEQCEMGQSQYCIVAVCRTAVLGRILPSLPRRVAVRALPDLGSPLDEKSSSEHPSAT